MKMLALTLLNHDLRPQLPINPMSEDGTDIGILKEFKLPYRNKFCGLGLISE